MIIKIIPETELEARRHPAAEFNNVKEFFMVGTQLPSDTEFHEWEGSYTYLMDSLNHYHDVILEEKMMRNVAQRAATTTVTLQKTEPAEPSPFTPKERGPTPSIRDVFNQVNQTNQANQVSELKPEDINNIVDGIQNKFAQNNEDQANPLE